MIDSSANNGQSHNEIVLRIVKELKSDFESDKEKEEFRKKYEYYKKIFLNESLTEDRSRLAKICRDKLNIINREEGRIGYQRLKVSSSARVVTIQDTMRK